MRSIRLPVLIVVAAAAILDHVVMTGSDAMTV
jgi:hypothetical protein